MSYTSKNLGPDETIIFIVHRSLWYSWVSFFTGAILALIGLISVFTEPTGFIPLGAGILLILLGYLRCVTAELAVTNKKVVAKHGIISRNTIEILMPKVESIHVRQGVFGRMFGLGAVVINGVGAAHAPIGGIKHPLEFRKHFLEAQDASENSKRT